MQWFIDLIKDWVIAQAYATEAWVIAKRYATITYVTAKETAIKAWVLEQLCTSTTRVYRTSNQRIPSGVWTKILFNVEGWDVNSEFANYKFTADKAGYFQVNLVAMGANITSGKRWQVAIYKNGDIYSQTVMRAVTTGYVSAYLPDMVYLNGIADYIEGFVFHDDVAARDVYGHPVYTFMSIHQLSKDSWL